MAFSKDNVDLQMNRNKKGVMGDEMSPHSSKHELVALAGN